MAVAGVSEMVGTGRSSSPVVVPADLAERAGVERLRQLHALAAKRIKTLKRGDTLIIRLDIGDDEGHVTGGAVESTRRERV